MTDTQTPMTPAEAAKVMHDYHLEVAGTHTEELQKLTAGENARNAQTDQGEVARNAQVDAKMQSVDPALHNHPVLRQSINQYGHLDANGNLEGWITNGQMTVEFSEVQTVTTGVPFADRPDDEKAILAAIGRGNDTHGRWFQPSIKVLRLDWSGWQDGVATHLFYPNQIWAGGNHVTMGCYARLLSGNAYAQIFEGITADWGLCGTTFQVFPGQYIHGHPYVNTASGSVEFFWAGLVNGAVNMDRDATVPGWGYYPSPYGTFNRDTAE